MLSLCIFTVPGVIIGGQLGSRVASRIPQRTLEISLAPDPSTSLRAGDPAFIGHYGGDQRQRDGAYHQGTVWGWLIGPFVTAHLRVYRDPVAARAFLAPFAHHLADHGLGSVSEIFDGDLPFTPRGCIAQAWSVAELLRAWQATQDSENHENAEEF